MPDGETHPVRSHRDAGMTLVEVIVAMTVFAVFAAAFAPIILQGFVIARSNAVQVVANQTAQEVLDAIVVQTTCTGILARGDEWAGDVPAIGGATLTVSVSLDSCPTSFPGTAHVTVVVAGDGAETTARTHVLVEGG